MDVFASLGGFFVEIYIFFKSHFCVLQLQVNSYRLSNPFMELIQWKCSVSEPENRSFRVSKIRDMETTTQSSFSFIRNRTGVTIPLASVHEITSIGLFKSFKKSHLSSGSLLPLYTNTYSFSIGKY